MAVEREFNPVWPQHPTLPRREGVSLHYCGYSPLDPEMERVGERQRSLYYYYY